MIKELSNYAATNSSMTLGTTLLSGYRDKDAVDRCTALLERPNPEFGNRRTELSLQILSRAWGYYQARDDCWEIFNLFHGNAAAGLTMPTIDGGTQYYVDTAECISGPQKIGQDAQGRFEFSANLLVHLREADS